MKEKINPRTLHFKFDQLADSDFPKLNSNHLKFRYVKVGIQEELKDGDNVHWKINYSTWNTNERGAYNWAHVEPGAPVQEGKWLNKDHEQ